MATDLTRIPPRAAGAIARVIASGDAKYEEGDWLERGSRGDISAALTHIAAFLEGSDLDDESGESHLAHAAARLAFVVEREARGVDVGDWRVYARASLAGRRPRPNKVPAVSDELEEPGARREDFAQRSGVAQSDMPAQRPGDPRAS